MTYPRGSEPPGSGSSRDHVKKHPYIYFWLTAGVLGVITTAITIAVTVPDGSPSRSTPPTPVPSPSPITVKYGTVTPAGTYVYSLPSTDVSSRVGILSGGIRVQIICTTQGAMATGYGSPSTLWNKVPYNGGTAYVPDVNLFTNSNQAVMPDCPPGT